MILKECKGVLRLLSTDKDSLQGDGGMANAHTFPILSKTKIKMHVILSMSF